ACPMCPYPETVAREPYEAMADDLWQKIALEVAAEPGFALLVPTSKNEPLLDRRLEERIAFFRQHAQPHQMVEVCTNGSLLDAERLKRLAAAGVDLVTISVNAADPETYAATSGGLSFQRLTANLASYDDEVKDRVNLFVRFVRTRKNAGQERAFRRRWRAAGFNVFAFEANNRSGAVKEYESLLAPPSLVHRGRQGLRRWLSRSIFPVCPYAFSSANILQNGDMVLCANDWANREVLGNVRQQSIREIFNGPRIQAIRELMRQNRYAEIGPCQNCSLWLQSNWL
ncbi:MAG: radical SAM/SPASM domain-containing protein, partial [Mycobacterium leprae]